MAKNGIIRPLKGGGCSECKASDQNVGKRRCNHVLDNAKMVVVDRHQRGVKFIDISGQVDGKNVGFSVKASDEEIKSYISNLSSGLSAKDKDDILNKLRNM